MGAAQVTAPASPARTGVWIAIATISMSFAAYTSALLVREGTTAGGTPFGLPPILFVNTLVLLVSSAAIAVGLRRMRAASGAGAPRSFAVLGGGWLTLALGLGLLFVAGQFLAWRDLAGRGLYLATNPASSFFYVFTALHAIHLLGGIAALGYVLWRLRRGPATPPVGAAGATVLYWHFMDVLWLYLLLVLALWL